MLPNIFKYGDSVMPRGVSHILSSVFTYIKNSVGTVKVDFSAEQLC